MRRRLGGLRKVMGKGSWSLVDQALFTGANGVLNVVLARALGPEDFGAYWLAFSIYLLAFPIHGALLVEPMLVFGAGRFRDAWPHYFALLLRGHWLVSFALSIALLIPGVALLAWRPGLVATGLTALALVAPLLLLQVFVRRACYAVHRPRLAAYAGVVYLVLLMGGTLGLERFGLLDVATAMFLMGLAALLSVLWLLPTLRGEVETRRPVGLEREVVRRHRDYGRWAVGYRLLRWVPTNMAYVLLPAFGALGAAGTLRALHVLYMPLAQATAAFSAIALPSLVAARQSGRFLSWVWGLLSVLVAGSLVYAALVGFGGNALLRVVYGEQYAGFGWLLWVLGAGMAFNVARELLSAGMRALERPELVFSSGLVATVLFAVLATWWIFAFGLVGAAYAMIVPAVVQTAILAYMLLSLALDPPATSEPKTEVAGAPATFGEVGRG